jgi:hypothetical protein
MGVGRRRESQIKANPREGCYLFVCTSFFRETRPLTRETRTAGMAEICRSCVQFARFASGVRGNERR